MGNKTSSLAAGPARGKGRSPSPGAGVAADGSPSPSAAHPSPAAPADPHTHPKPAPDRHLGGSLDGARGCGPTALPPHPTHTDCTGEERSSGGSSGRGGRRTPSRNPFTPAPAVKDAHATSSGSGGGYDGAAAAAAAAPVSADRRGWPGSSTGAAETRGRRGGSGDSSGHGSGHGGGAHAPGRANPYDRVGAAAQPSPKRISTSPSPILGGVRPGMFQRRTDMGPLEAVPPPSLSPPPPSAPAGGAAAGSPAGSGGRGWYPGGECSESALSDITVSEMSATLPNDMAPRNSLSAGVASGFGPAGHPSAGGAGYGFPAGIGGWGGGLNFLSRGEDLEQQRQQAPLSIEEDLFIYDDIVISKDEARTKHWRLAGRKPPPMPVPAPAHAGEAGGGGAGGGAPPGSTAAAAGGGAKRLSGGKSFFSFNDFAVCVDEMDLAPSSSAEHAMAQLHQRELGELDNTARLGSDAGALGSAASLSVLSASSGAVSAAGAGSAAAGAAMGSALSGAALSGVVNRTQQRRTLNASMSMSVVNTVAVAPNTARVHEARRRAEAPTSNRPLKKFSTEPLLGHAARVKCIALSPDERELASCSNEDASVALSNLGVRDEVGIFTGHQDTVINVTFSPDGKYLATTSKDRTMILWDVMTTKQLLTFSHAKVVICCCFAPDSKYLVSGCQDRICRLWDTRRGKEWLTYTHHDAIIIAVAFSPRGGYVCSASADKTLRVWSSTTAKTRFTLTGHVGIILSCSFTSDGKYIISNDESLLRVWSTTDGSCTLSLAAADVAGSTHLTPKGPKLGWTLSCAAPGAFTGYLCVACNNRFVYVLDRKTGKEVASTFCKAPVYCLTSGTEEVMACGDSFGNIYLLRMH